MRNIAQKATRSRFWQVPIYVAMFVMVTTLLTFPLTVYENFFREHSYGLSNQNFWQWLGDFGTAFAVQLVGSAIALTLIYAVIRGSRRLWWAWGTLVAVIFFAAATMITPVFISPLFNHYQPLAESPLKDDILVAGEGERHSGHNVYRSTPRGKANAFPPTCRDFSARRASPSTTISVQAGTPAESASGAWP